MKLTTKISVQKIRVIADYQRKENNPMFIAILKAAYENDNFITVENAKNRLSGAALNTRMWKNIFDRLIAQKYFEKRQRVLESAIEDDDWDYEHESNDEDYYELTDFGKEAAEQDTFFKQMKGELEIWIVEDKIDWLPFQVIKIEESKNSYKEIEGNQNISRFNLPLATILDLKKASFRLEKVENKCKFLGIEEVKLVVNSSEDYTSVSLQDLDFNLYNNETELTETQLQKTFLLEEYSTDYDFSNSVIRIPFDKNIQFQRNVRIEKPTIGKVVFDGINLPNINFMAKTEADAEQWRLAWIQANVRDYIFENSEFEKLAYQIWKNFEPYFRLSLLTLSDFEDYLKEDETANFYQLMKLQAPKLLNY